MKLLSDVIPSVRPSLKQSFIGVWFHDNNLSIDEREKMRFHFNRIFYYYRIVMDMTEFITYLVKERLVAKIFLIISDFTLYMSLLKLTQKHSELFEKIYIFLPTEEHIVPTTACFTTSCRRRLLDELAKDILEYTIKNNPSNIAANRIPLEINPINTFQFDRILPSISVLNSKHQHHTPIRHMTKESLKFLSFLTMIDILLQLKHDPEDISEMWTACRNLYRENNTQLDHIDKLAKTYRKDEAVQHYTGNSCLSRTVNQTCHTEDMQGIYTFRVYISDLHSQLNAFNEQRLEKALDRPGDIVFRGKLLSGSVLQPLIDNQDGLILLNGFLSTTCDPEVAFMYAGEKEPSIESRPVLFQLHTDNKIKQPFADISHCSTKEDEAEILFSLGTLWRIGSVDLDKNPCEIKLKSCDELNSDVTKLFEKYTRESCTLLSLGDILYELGEDIEAEWFYRKMLEKDPLDDKIRGILYHKIGMIRFGKEDYFAALDNWERSVQLMEPSNNEVTETQTTPLLYMYNRSSPFLTIYNNMGLVFQKNSHADIAIKYYMKALEKGGSELERATVHNNLGVLYSGRGDYTEAYEQHKKAVELMDERHLHYAEFRRNFLRAEKRLGHLSNPQNESNNNN